MRINRRQLAATAAAIPILGTSRGFAQTTPVSSPVNALDEEMAEASSRITSLGQYVPGGQLDGRLDLAWVDVERQLFAIARGTEGEERSSAFIQSTFGYVPNYFQNAFQLKDLVGFSDLDILASLSAGMLPESLQMARLKIEVAELVPFWLEQGYEERENEFGTFWTIGEEAEVDLAHPVQQVLISQFNNIAILEEHIIAFAPTSAVLGDAMATVTEDSPNVLPGLATITEALPETAVGAWFIDGNNVAYSSGNAMSPELAAQMDDQIAESNDAAGEMPEIRTICTGTTEGASRDESLHEDSAVAFVLLETEGDPEQVAAVVQWRLENMLSSVIGQPYQEIIGEIDAEPVGDSVLRISSQQGASRAVFTQMMAQADSLLFAY